MALMINTNISSLNAQRNLMRSSNALSTSFKRLSSGLRVNSASDDAAGFSISDRMQVQIRGLNQSVRNANDAIPLVQVAEGALDETTNALQRIRELAVQAANDTYVGGDREDMQKEIDVLVEEIQRISTDTQFNDQDLLEGNFATGGGKIFHVGADKDQTIQVSIDAVSVVALGVDSNEAFFYSANIDTNHASQQDMAESLITVVDNALDSVSDVRSALGAYQNRFESIIANLSNVSESTTAARSRILDADIAAETAMLTRNAILQQAGTAILAQANQQPQIALQLLG